MPPLVDPPARTINLGWTGSRRLRREQPARVELSKSRRLERRRREEVSMKLYEFPPTRSIRPRWMLQELEVPFESVWVDLPKGEHRSADFLKLNPAGKVPVLVDGDVVLNESVAGDRVTAADFVVAYTLDWANENGLLGGFPASTAYMERMYRRPKAALRIREAFKQIQA
jgi:glutathione S-transferase